MHPHRTIVAAGTRYGRLSVIRDTAPYRNPITGKATRRLLLRCDCGNECSVMLSALRNKSTQSCGCLHRERLADRNRSHNLVNSPEYHSWANMLTRCLNPKSQDWKLYGGRGITVCPEWRSFEGFYADMGAKPSPTMTLDRINSNLGYFAGNCRWASPREQARNISTNRRLTHLGETLCLAEWAERAGIPSGTIGQRLARGWSIVQALTTPLGTYRTDNRWLTHDGETLSISTWARRLGIANSTLGKRLESGWSISRAVTTPLRHRGSDPGTVSSDSTEGPNKPQ